MSNEDLLKSFQVISELENRKITYEKAISKVEQEIENAGMWYREAEPIQPTQNLNHYWNKHSLRALLLFFILIPVFLLFFNAISQHIYETFEYEMNSYFATVGSIILAVISMCIVQVSLFNRMCKKENEAYFSEYHQVQQHNKQEQEQAEARSNWMRIDRKEDLKDWRSYCYQIDQKLRQLYQAQEIPKTYQGAIAMSLFVSYLQTGRCDTLKECMNKFDDDSAFYQLKGEIEEIIREIGEMKQRLSRELSFTRQCLNDDLENVELLVQKNQTQIEQISYNQETQRLLLATAFLEEQ